MKPSTIRRVLASAVEGWWNDRALSMGAAIAFYTLFALAPILITVVAIAGLVFGQEAAHGALVSELNDFLGEAGAKALEAMLANASYTDANILMTLIGIGAFFIFATGAFVELQDSLNLIWKAKPSGHWGISLLRNRLISFAFIIGIGFLLMVSLAVDATLTAVGSVLSDTLAGWPTVVMTLNSILAVSVAMLLFAMIFKILPDAPVSWREAWIGGILTGLMFTIGKFAIGFYLGRSGVASTYGAAASLVTVLLWIYYSSQILLFGAEITKAVGDVDRASAEEAVSRQ